MVGRLGSGVEEGWVSLCTGSARESVRWIVRFVATVSCVRLPPVSFYRYRVQVARAQPSVRWLRPFLTRVAPTAPCIMARGSHDFRPRLPTAVEESRCSTTAGRLAPVWPLRTQIRMHAMHAPGGFVWACGRLSGHATQERAELEEGVELGASP